MRWWAYIVSGHVNIIKKMTKLVIHYKFYSLCIIFKGTL